jgi:hypothetical protein
MNIVQEKPTRPRHVILALIAITLIGLAIAPDRRSDSSAPDRRNSSASTSWVDDDVTVFKDSMKPFESVLYYDQAVLEIAVVPTTYGIAFLSSNTKPAAAFSSDLSDTFLCAVQEADPAFRQLTLTKNTPVKVTGFVHNVRPARPMTQKVAGSGKTTWLADCSFQIGGTIIRPMPSKEMLDKNF